MPEMTHEPGRCGFNVTHDDGGETITGWNHDPEELDCTCTELGLTGCDCEVCHSLRRINELCADDCQQCRNPSDEVVDD